MIEDEAHDPDEEPTSHDLLSRVGDDSKCAKEDEAWLQGRQVQQVAAAAGEVTKGLSAQFAHHLNQQKDENGSAWSSSHSLPGFTIPTAGMAGLSSEEAATINFTLAEVDAALSTSMESLMNEATEVGSASADKVRADFLRAEAGLPESKVVPEFGDIYKDWEDVYATKGLYACKSNALTRLPGGRPDSSRTWACSGGIYDRRYFKRVEGKSKRNNGCSAIFHVQKVCHDSMFLTVRYNNAPPSQL